jgi:hypothetical protein
MYRESVAMLVLLLDGESIPARRRLPMEQMAGPMPRLP